MGAYTNNKLIYGNRVIIKQLVGAMRESDIVREKIKQINKEKAEFEQKIKALTAALG